MNTFDNIAHVFLSIILAGMIVFPVCSNLDRLWARVICAVVFGGTVGYVMAGVVYKLFFK